MAIAAATPPERSACGGPIFSLALEEPHDGDEVARVEGMRFEAGAKMRNEIETSGGLTIDFAKTLFGPAFRIRRKIPSACCCS